MNTLPSTADHSLRIHEWIAIAVVTVAFALIAIVTWTSSGSEPLETVREGYLSVDIEGCVRHPGTYQLLIGATVQQALDLAETLPEASYQGLRRNSVLKNGQLIRVREQSWMTVYLEGAVQKPGPFKVRHGTRLIDLIGKAPLKKEADTAFLKRKRRLKADELITIPEKGSSDS